MEIHYSTLQLPEIKSKLSGPEYRVLKANIATLMLGQRYETFEAQASASRPWAPIKDVDGKLKTVRKDYAKELEAIRSGDSRKTKLSKKAQKMRDSDKILVKTGILRASFTGEQAGIEIEEDEILIFTNVEYAAIHNYGGVIDHPGTKNGFGKGVEIPGYKITIPARPFDEFTEEHEEQITEMIQEYLDGD